MNPSPFLLALLLLCGADDTSPGNDPLTQFLRGESEEALLLARGVTADPEAESEDVLRALTAVAGVHMLRNEADAAAAAMTRLLAEDPTADLPEVESLPPPLVDAFYRLRDGAMLSAGLEQPRSPWTLAVGEIQNNAIVQGAFNLDAFARGLSQILTSDLDRASALTLVDRRRLRVLREEIALSQSAMADADTRVPVGRLTGARTYLFGSLVQVEERRLRLDLRWVDTATGEILLAEGREQDIETAGDLLRLERAVLLDLLLPKLESFLDSPGALREDLRGHLEDKEKSLHKDYVRETVAVGEAIMAEDQERWADALDAWERVISLNPEHVAAPQRRRALLLWLGREGSR